MLKLMCCEVVIDAGVIVQSIIYCILDNQQVVQEQYEVLGMSDSPFRYSAFYIENFDRPMDGQTDRQS